MDKQEFVAFFVMHEDEQGAMINKVLFRGTLKELLVWAETIEDPETRRKIIVLTIEDFAEMSEKVTVH